MAIVSHPAAKHTVNVHIHICRFSNSLRHSEDVNRNTEKNLFLNKLTLPSIGLGMSKRESCSIASWIFKAVKKKY